MDGGRKTDPTVCWAELMKFWGSVDVKECQTSKNQVHAVEDNSERVENYNLVEEMGLGPSGWMQSS